MISVGMGNAGQRVRSIGVHVALSVSRLSMTAQVVVDVAAKHFSDLLGRFTPRCGVRTATSKIGPE